MLRHPGAEDPTSLAIGFSPDRPGDRIKAGIGWAEVGCQVPVVGFLWDIMGIDGRSMGAQ